MAETARRMVHGHGSDVVRRLIARPIRMQASQTARPVFTEAVRPTEPVAETRPDAAVLPNVDRLRIEMLVMKAVLQAERHENESLRACLGLDEADASLGGQARAMRDRWATLVDRLLHAPA